MQKSLKSTRKKKDEEEEETTFSCEWWIIVGGDGVMLDNNKKKFRSKSTLLSKTMHFWTRTLPYTHIHTFKSLNNELPLNLFNGAFKVVRAHVFVVWMHVYGSRTWIPRCMLYVDERMENMNDVAAFQLGFSMSTSCTFHSNGVCMLNSFRRWCVCGSWRWQIHSRKHFMRECKDTDHFNISNLISKWI